MEKIKQNAPFVILDKNQLKDVPLKELKEHLENLEIYLQETLCAIETININKDYFKTEHIDIDNDKIVIACRHNIENIKEELIRRA